VIVVAAWKRQFGERAVVPEPLARFVTGKVSRRRRWFKRPAGKNRWPLKDPKPQLNPFSAWTDIEDRVIRLFPPPEAAMLLGRTRRDLQAAEPAHDRKGAQRPEAAANYQTGGISVGGRTACPPGRHDITATLAER
jgi:hypothetical protein